MEGCPAIVPPSEQPPRKMLNRPVAVRHWPAGTGITAMEGCTAIVPYKPPSDQPPRKMLKRPVALRHWPDGTGPRKKQAAAKAVSLEANRKKASADGDQEDENDAWLPVTNSLVSAMSKGKTGSRYSSNSKGKKQLERTPFRREGKGRIVDSFRVVPASVEDEAKARKEVIKALKLFEQLRRLYMQKEQASSSKKTRLDMVVGKEMREKGLWVNHGTGWLGNVPGVEVGDIFYFRFAMCIVGLHNASQAGIGWVKGEQNKWGEPVASSIVLSGGYEDDRDNGETFVYTGQGGNNYKGDRRQAEDQQLERGNLALVNSYKFGVPVRVVRGGFDSESPTGRTYSYDGLYRVLSWRRDKGAAGYIVFKFLLKRCDGQPPLASSLVTFAGSLQKKPTTRQNVLRRDISGGLEAVPVCVVNDVDNCPFPKDFFYRSRIEYPRFKEPRPSYGVCHCTACNGNSCECVAKNGGTLPYTHAGTLVNPTSVVYECGRNCRCASSCPNRATQRGLTRNLEIFRTEEKGWGVRSWQSIPCGSFVCEIVGEVIHNKGVQQRTGNYDYIFDVDFIKGKQAQVVDISRFCHEVSLQHTKKMNMEEGNIFLDASKFGNVSRFINHSCSPNLFVQCVFHGNEDSRLPHLMLFAMDNIRPFEELTYDYKCVRYGNGKVNVKRCCGAKNCRERL